MVNGMDQIFCSVIIPVYNVREYLEQCVQSVLAQTDGQFELILVDDGSTDGSDAICDRYAVRDARVRVLHQKNGGHTSARNAGLRAAQGEYVAFMDSDDWVDCGLLADCLECVKEYRPDIVLYGYRRVTGGAAQERPQPLPPGYYDRPALEKAVLPELLPCGRFSLCERLVRRKLIEKHQLQIDPEILLGEDLAVCVCTMSEARSICVLPGCYYNYRQHEGSVSHKVQNYTFRNWLLLRAYLDRYLSGVIPGYSRQIGTCSIRFLQRAVLGEITREGFRPQTLRDIRCRLSEPELRADLRNARFPKGKRMQRFKLFCLRRRWVAALYLSNCAVSGARSLRGRL